MHFSTALTTLATALAVASKGSAFVMEIFDSVDCTGTSRHVNVYDNTCATWMGGFNSYLPKVYGGTHQRAFFFVPGNCGDLPGAYDTKWVDGGVEDFKIDQCNSFGEGHWMNAVASYRG